jgi:CheY-like chemotaxis protein
MTHVLIVDDEPDICSSLRMVLEDEGYDATCLHDGVAALAFLRASIMPLIVLLDHLMPGMDGGHLLREVAGEPELMERHQYVLVTAAGWAKVAKIADVLAVFSAPVLEKPFEVDDLLAAVREAERRILSSR